MKIRIAIVAAVLSLLVPVALAQKAAPFSADIKMTMSMGQGMTMDGKLYFGGEKVRMEFNGPMGEMINITDPAKQTTYTLMPAQKKYMEMNTAAMGGRRRGPDLKPFDPANPCANTPNTTCKKLGTESVNGRSCDKWEFTTSGNTSTIWIDQKLSFPIKTQAENVSVEMTNIKEGAQDPKLFEVPSDYQKMDMPGMGNRGPGE